MPMRPYDAPLIAYLKNKNNLYHGKFLELRETVEGWLSYIPNTFPHYTRHTVQHSDEIIVQASKLLFRDDDPDRPSINLSSIEAYILVASAYLHDAGMVTADQEKLDILKSEAWSNWTSGGESADRWQNIQKLRK